jgi:hypothetical protein
MDHGAVGHSALDENGAIGTKLDALTLEISRSRGDGEAVPAMRAGGRS